MNVGTDAAPTFIDIDNDGDNDAFIGAGKLSSASVAGRVYFYRNTGNRTHPTMVKESSRNNPFAEITIGNHAKPTFCDLDGDSDPDAFVGDAGTDTANDLQKADTREFIVYLVTSSVFLCRRHITQNICCCHLTLSSALVEKLRRRSVVLLARSV